MEEFTLRKNGLIYINDYKTVVGIDSDSGLFDGSVPNGPSAVEEEAFSCCGLKKITLPDSVTYLGANLFCNSTALESVKLPAFVKKLPPFLFCGCKSLKEVAMPLEVEDFSEGLFAGCEVLSEIPFRAGIKTLPENVFDSCYAIKSLVIPASVTKICENAIANCTALETLVLPANLEILEDDWLVNCPKLKHIRISSENKNFKTDEENCILYKTVGDAEIPLITLKNRTEENLPGFKEPDTENSIITFDENEDETMDYTNIFDLDESLTEEKNEDLVSADNVEGAEAQPADEEQNDEKTSERDDDMDSRLREILGQNKMYSENEFSIMDIPAASEEEITSDKLAPSFESEETAGNAGSERTDVSCAENCEDSGNVENIENTEKPENMNAENTAEQSQSMEDKLKEIMSQNDGGFSICDIPVATDEEIAANKLFESGNNSAETECAAENSESEDVLQRAPAACGAENADETYDEAQSAEAAENSVDLQSENGNCEESCGASGFETEYGTADDSDFCEERVIAKAAENAESAENVFMNNIVFESQKVFQQNTGICGESRTLFVFAENLVSTPLGEKFSASLKKLCTRLSKIHNFTSIYYFYNTRIDTEKFKAQFINFMKDKDVVVACDGQDIYNITERTVAFCGFVNISLSPSDVQKEFANAKNPEIKPLKLIVQDNLEE